LLGPIAFDAKLFLLKECTAANALPLLALEKPCANLDEFLT
jgi:hypothetical protein